MAEWRSIPGYEGRYEVSDEGQVQSCARIILQMRRDRSAVVHRPWKARIMSPRITPKGYLRVALYSGASIGHTYEIQVLVALAFIGPRPEGTQVCHNDGKPGNCRLENLRYDTPKGNVADSVVHGTFCRGERSGMAKLTDDAVRFIRAHAGKIPQSEMALMFGVGQASISKVVCGDTWVHVEAA
jgi:hypothetical protein